MRPYITIGQTEIYMTGLGIVLGFTTFIVSVYVFSQKTKLSFKNFFNSLPMLIVFLYVIGSYLFLIIEHGTFIPDRQALTTTFSPYGYNFHFIGVVVGFIFYLLFFLKKIKNPRQRRKRIDVFFYSVTISLIPLGFFLVLGDDFIGITTNSPLGIQSFTDKSKLSKYATVMPVGIFISFAAIITLLFIEGIKKRYKKIGVGFLGFGVLSFLLSIVFLYQQYPKHGVAKFFGMTVDIKQYVAWIIAIFCIYAYTYTSTRKRS